MVSECLHGMVTGTCTLCRVGPRRGRGVLSRFNSTCRLCHFPIHVGDRIRKRLHPAIHNRWVWAHDNCPSYVETLDDRHERIGRRDPVATQPLDRASRAQITFWAQDEEE